MGVDSWWDLGLFDLPSHSASPQLQGSSLRLSVAMVCLWIKMDWLWSFGLYIGTMIQWAMAAPLVGQGVHITLEEKLKSMAKNKKLYRFWTMNTLN